MRYPFVKKENVFARLTVAFGLFFLFSCAGNNTPEVNPTPSQEVSESTEAYYDDDSAADYVTEEAPTTVATGGTIETSIYVYRARQRMDNHRWRRQRPLRIL